MTISREDVRWAYQTILGRDPEQDDIIETWVNLGADLKTLVATLATSPEARRRRETALSADDVRWAYRTILGRDPESEGLVNKWVELGTGLRSLVTTLVNSPEARREQRPVSPDDVRWAYRTIFGRDPERDSIIDTWVERGPDLKTLLSSLAGSDEARRKKAMPPLFSYDSSVGTQERAMAIVRRLAPVEAEGFEKRRLGGDNDGGYVMLDDFDNVRIAYSLGIKDDVSLDLALAEKGIEIYQYDHTIDRLPSENERFHWIRKGIGRRNGFDANFVTLAEAVAENGHADESDLVLKCDIEGSEWDMLGDVPAPVLNQFRQIVIELHALNLLHDTSFADRAEAAIAKLTENHSVVHVHGNNCSSYSILGGVPLPAVLELTLVRTADKTLHGSTETFPTTLDMPCTPDLADFQLGRFVF